MGRNHTGRRSRSTEGGDEEMGATEEGRSTFRRKGKEGRKSAGPMGERPSSDLRSRISGPARNSPALVRDGSSSKASTSAVPPTESAIETLRVFLTSRYSPGDKMLNLENMSGDPLLISAGLKAPGSRGAPHNLAPALWKLAGRLFPDIVSLSLAHNSLSSIINLSPYYLIQHLPNVVNLSLASNMINSLRELDPLSPVSGGNRKGKGPKGLPGLRELVMTGNPCVETGPREEAYRIEVSRKFPSLRQLDQQPLDPSIAFATAASTSKGGPGSATQLKREKKGSKIVRTPVVFPVAVNAGFFEAEGTRDFVAGFFMKFFPAFDSDRPSLMAAYSPTCSFSFFADTSYPVRARAKKIGSHTDKSMPHQTKLDWKLYLTAEGSRNLARVKVPEKRVATLQITPSMVISSICKLPTTAHPLTPTKFVFDTWTMPGVLAASTPGGEGETVILAVVHGEFVEMPSKGVRSFDRTFILAPAPEGSPAHVAGWPCTILSDVLNVRMYSNPTAWEVLPPAAAIAPNAVAGPSSVVAPPLGTERAEGLSDGQQAMILEFQVHTKLVYGFAHLCLSQNGFDPVRGMENFQMLNSSGGIPREAFLL